MNQMIELFEITTCSRGGIHTQELMKDPLEVFYFGEAGGSVTGPVGCNLVVTFELSTDHEDFESRRAPHFDSESNPGPAAHAFVVTM